MIRLWRASVADVLAIAAAALVEIGRSLVGRLLSNDDDPGDTDFGGDD